MKILLAVDGSAHTQRMLDFLAKHRAWLGQAEFTVVHSVPSVPPGAANMLRKDDLKAYYEEQAEQVFSPVRQALQAAGVEATYAGRVGPAAEHIARVAEDGGHDLLMMGSHGHGAIGKLLLGSVATRVMAQCATPVLLVR